MFRYRCKLLSKDHGSGYALEQRMCLQECTVAKGPNPDILQFKYLISTYCSGKLVRGSGLWQQASLLTREAQETKIPYQPRTFFRMMASYLQFQVGHFLNRCTIPPYCRSKAQETTITKALKQFICTHKTKSLDKPSLLSRPSMPQSLHFSSFLFIVLHWYSQKFQFIQANNAN